MGKALIIVMMALMFVGCGTPRDSLPVGFVNHSGHADSELQAIWRAAQQAVATQIDLNPLERQSNPDAVANMLPGDKRALKIEPRQVEVTKEPDVASGLLLSQTGVQRVDPTGLISCPQPCNVRYAAAYSWYGPASTKYAASWDAQTHNFDLILQYEFENQILFALNYDMKWR
jgi:hypothetical protein